MLRLERHQAHQHLHSLQQMQMLLVYLLICSPSRLSITLAVVTSLKDPVCCYQDQPQHLVHIAVLSSMWALWQRHLQRS